MKKNIWILIISIVIIALLAVVFGYFYKFDYKIVNNKLIETSQKMSESEAQIIAEKNCIKGGGSLASGYYNENSKTWWFDANLNATKEGCNPACVVKEDKTTEINWRCTGFIAPE